MMGLFMEEIELGKCVALGSHVFTRENMLAYAHKFNPAGCHVDDEAGRASPYGAMTAAGMHTASCWMKCFVATNTQARDALAAAGKILPDLGPSPGFKNLRWLRPVFAGDEISYFATPTQARLLRSKPGWGIVSGYNEGVNQKGDLVFSFESAVLTKSR
jgi:acyl dehydratase